MVIVGDTISGLVDPVADDELARRGYMLDVGPPGWAQAGFASVSRADGVVHTNSSGKVRLLFVTGTSSYISTFTIGNPIQANQANPHGMDTDLTTGRYVFAVVPPGWQWIVTTGNGSGINVWECDI